MSLRNMPIKYMKLFKAIKLNYLRQHNWPWWMKFCCCGAKIYNLQTKFGKFRRCSNSRDKCPLYQEHDELIKQGHLTVIKPQIDLEKVFDIINETI